MTTRSLPYTQPGDPSTGSEIASGVRGQSEDPPRGLPEIDSVSARAGSENFRVVSRLLPGDIRGALMDIYRYARFVDEIGDSYDGDRLAALDWVESELRRGVAGDPHESRDSHDSHDSQTHPILAAAANLVRAQRISLDPLLNLVEANRRDQTVSRYESFSELLGYCRLSANPVGRLVLELFGASTPEREQWSDAICTGLQLAEHWQDVGEDARAGRIYLPSEDLRRFEVDQSELVGDGPASAALRSAIAFECGRARELLNSGSPLIISLRGRLKIAVAGFWAGGHAALDALESQAFDPLARPARPNPRRVVLHMFRGVRR